MTADYRDAALRLTVLLDQWESSGSPALEVCARKAWEAVEADDVMSGYMSILDRKHASELDEMKALVRRVETLDLGGYTQRDADAVAVALFAAGYRRHPTS